MKNRIEFHENKLEHYFNWAKHYFNQYIGPIIGIALFSFLTYENYNLREEVNNLRTNIFWRGVDVIRMTSHKIKQLDEINEEKIKLIVSLGAGNIDSSMYKERMDSLKALENSLYEQERKLTD